MSEKKFINVKVRVACNSSSDIKIPTDIDEIKLKGLLRDLGYIPFHSQAYRTTKVYLLSDDGTKTKKEICLPEYRSITELGIKEGSKLYIIPGEEPLPRVVEYRPTVVRRGFGGFGRALYGCPMAQSVEDAINDAEGYSAGDSITTTGSIDS